MIDSNQKYIRCVELLEEMHQIIYIMIETNMIEDMSPIEIIEECFNALKTIEDETHIKKIKSSNRKERENKKGIIH
jgi:hypothetical protein